LQSLCARSGALLILDKIQTGFGRTGRLLGCEWEGVSPDVVALGKSLGGGIYPIPAALFQAKLTDFLVANPFNHLSTFGGVAPGCAVGLATIEYLLAQDLAGQAQGKLGGCDAT